MLIKRVFKDFLFLIMYVGGGVYACELADPLGAGVMVAVTDAGTGD